MLTEETHKALFKGDSNKTEADKEKQKTKSADVDYETAIRAIYSDDSHRYSGLVDEN